MDLINREDRIGAYLTPQLNDFIFDELSPGYLEKAELTGILSGVSVPIRRDELENISILSIARAMAFVIGCHPQFQYRGNYIKYILKFFDKNFAKGLVAEGVEAAQKNNFEYACIQFRAAMLIDPENIDALYCYGRSCKDAYENGEEEDYIARFKAESIEAFEEVTLRKPDFAESYYFLGYGYLNLGLYIKAKLTWKEFLKLSCDEEKKNEIEERLALLDEPVEIEEGYNMILSGKFHEGIEGLSKYTEGRFADWWPLWYYLGTAHMALEMLPEAVEEFKKVLLLSPSNEDTMKELVKAYEALGDEEKAEKYRKKIVIVQENAAKDREEANKEKAANTARISSKKFS